MRTTTFIAIIITILLMNFHCTDGTKPSCPDNSFTWDSLPPIPDATGFAGSFAGISNGALIVAGGANFPNDGAPWKPGSVKTWYDKVFVLEKFGRNWREGGHLPMPLGYGVSASVADGLIIAGGSNEHGHTDKVYKLSWQQETLQVDNLPSLPFPLANTSGAVAGHYLYIAGGLQAADSTATSSAFLQLDLHAIGQGWRQLPHWPGPSRMLAVAGAIDDRFYLFSGTQLVDGKRQYLTDAYVYTLAEGWKILPPLPHSVVAAPSPAYATTDGQLLVVGGDDGVLAPKAGELKEQHPGFSDAILVYNTKENRWHTGGKIMTRKDADAAEYPNHSVWAPVTTTLVQWDGKLVLPGGEVRPATRTPRVLVGVPCNTSGD